VESDLIVQIFRTPEEIGQEFTKYELTQVTSVEVDLDRRSKRTHGTRSHSP
jgi:hypothetical protein